jgi:bifunctional UDP-N-acetylglucosamine pyrophosphorylase/glucosamine-1-phosphate N-acetyltransferase
MTAPVVVILAAGQGTRMRSATPKLLHPLCGRPLIGWPVAAALGAGARSVVVVDSPARALDAVLGDDAAITVVVQEQPRGTADAVKAAASQIGADDTVIVIAGDVPLITPETIRSLVDAHAESGAAATMVTAILDDPTGYGRVVRAPDGTVERVVETKAPGDASELELHIREVNTSVYAFEGGALLAALEEITPDNAQGELYLPDVLPVIHRHERSVLAFEVGDTSLALGVNDRVGLATVTAIAQRRINEAHMDAGVTLVNPEATVIDVDVVIGADTVIAPFSSLHGATRIGSGCTIGPVSTLIDVQVGDGAKVVHSYATGARIGDRVSVGPFAYLRPGTILREGSKAGAFVEIKNSDIGAGAKVPHLSYIGDADIGDRTNIGAGTITANYDGANKSRTTIGAGAFVSVDTMFVAPVTLGDGAYTAAGSVITNDVPPGALGVARARQTNVDGYGARRAQRDGTAKKQPASSEKDPSPPAPE